MQLALPVDHFVGSVNSTCKWLRGWRNRSNRARRLDHKYASRLPLGQWFNRSQFDSMFPRVQKRLQTHPYPDILRPILSQFLFRLVTQNAVLPAVSLFSRRTELFLSNWTPHRHRKPFTYQRTNVRSERRKLDENKVDFIFQYHSLSVFGTGDDIFNSVGGKRAFAAFCDESSCVKPI